jgi:flavin-dependent dehydrogenase
MSNRVGKRSMVLGYRIQFTKSQYPWTSAIHLVDKLNFQNYGQEGESIYSISRGALNKRMIDLAEQAGAEFFFEQKIWDVTLSEATLHIGETERGAWEEKKYEIVLVLMVLF